MRRPCFINTSQRYVIRDRTSQVLILLLWYIFQPPYVWGSSRSQRARDGGHQGFNGEVDFSGRKLQGPAPPLSGSRRSSSAGKLRSSIALTANDEKPRRPRNGHRSRRAIDGESGTELGRGNYSMEDSTDHTRDLNGAAEHARVRRSDPGRQCNTYSRQRWWRIWMQDGLKTVASRTWQRGLRGSTFKSGHGADHSPR